MHDPNLYRWLFYTDVRCKNTTWQFNTYLNHCTIMLLIGMCISLTKNPMKPIIANPIAVATAIFWNSKQKIKSFIFIRYIPFNWHYFDERNFCEYSRVKDFAGINFYQWKIDLRETEKWPKCVLVKVSSIKKLTMVVKWAIQLKTENLPFPYTLTLAVNWLIISFIQLFMEQLSQENCSFVRSISKNMTVRKKFP